MRPPRDRRAAAAVAVLVALFPANAAGAPVPPTRAQYGGSKPPAEARPSRATPAVPGGTPKGAGPSAAPPAIPAGTATPGAAAAPALGPDPAAESTSLSGPGPLVANGLGSPTCRRAGELSAAARADCAASGVAVAPAPLENYQFDVHIDVGIWNGRTESVIQDVLLKPVWMAVVWLTDVAVVALEWCFSLDLLGSGALGPVTRGLQSMRDALTTPWLAPALAIAAVALVYNGIVRRRVVDTIGQFALLMAMMIGGLWVMTDPAGTVGEASQLVNEASLGVLGAATSADPGHAFRSLDDGLRPLFDAAVSGPWCYLEFGDVAWCRDRTRLDPRLVATARQIVAVDRTAATSPSQRRQVRAEADLIAAAQTNGQLFLALPANGPRRNSINADPTDPSLLHTLCGGDDTTACPADTGPQAEFRTRAGTAARTGGLLLIVAGCAGMFALVGFISLRLLGAALLALVYLLLAPVAVLAPALGDAGRDAFRRWALRLLGAVLAKLIYSVFLGVALLMTRTLAGLDGLGWWTQWLLIAAFWWLAFNHRHRLLETVIHERAESGRHASLASKLFATRQAMKLAEGPSKRLRATAKRTSERFRHFPERVLGPVRRRANEQRGEVLAEQVARTLERDHAAAVATVAHAPQRELELADLRARRDRIGRAQRDPGVVADPRQALGLQRRRRDLDAKIEAGERALAEARAAASAGEDRRRATGVVHDAQQRARRAEQLDREAEIRPRLAGRKDRRVGRRDYANLAVLIGPGRAEYERLSEPERLRAQLAIDRELETRRELKKKIAAKPDRRPAPRGRPQPPGGSDPRPPRRPVSSRERQFDRRPSHRDADYHDADYDRGPERRPRSSR